MSRIDYDAVADRYDEPERDYAADARLLDFLAGRADLRLEQLRILDAGCGTGKQVAANHEAIPVARLVGLDRSAGMLRIARARCQAAAWVRGDAAVMPFASSTFAYATSQYSYHHVGRTAGFVQEVFRVLQPGGRFVLTNIDPWAMPGWLVYRFFPEALARDHRDFLPAGELAAALGAAGFENIRISRTDRSRDEDLAHFLAYASERHRASQFTALSDEQYHAGLERLKGAIGAGAPSIRSEFVVMVVIADRPPAAQP